ncbi:MAG: polyribonucleotide nucleotidyltransferase [Candidatus Shikimatogenerans bostrichidophilus]|nr:MAG: polyribonucleotide nucleotidyltransferase [Candidatus Shikimatogenerans bostrichidophilus]
MYKRINKVIKIKNNRKIILETGQIANLSDGSVIIRLGDTILLTTVVIGDILEKTNDFIPLTIDYREKYFASGKIPGGYIKREGRPSEEEIITMRIVDRLIRPLLPKNLINEIQIMISLLSYDKKVAPDGLVGLAASTALLISGIPYYGPASQIRIARINKLIIINPTIEEIKLSDINLIIGGTYNSILMIEGDMKEINNKDFIKIVKYAHYNIKKQIKSQLKFYYKVKKNIFKKKIYFLKNKKLKQIIRKKTFNKILYILNNIKNKKKRQNKLKKILYNFKNKFNKKFISYNEFLFDKYYNFFNKIIIRAFIEKKSKRLDGRSLDQIRDIDIINGFLPGVHGSTLFTRGETQCLTTVTLGSSLDANRIDNVVIEDNETFYLHYNFPPFSTGEIKQNFGVSRREVGHGHLAKNALKNMIPNNNQYTIRVVSDILSSNGSSSMATVCAGSLSLIDAGIKIKNKVAGIAIGYINKKKGKGIILSDILGEEDHYGDLDFKIGKTKNGITACQMDIKDHRINILNNSILKNILKKSDKCIHIILRKMKKSIINFNSKDKLINKFTLLKIPSKYIGTIIGKGGQNIKKIERLTNTNIVIKEKDDYGVVEILGNNKNYIDAALKIIKKLIFTPKIGYIYNAKIINIKNYKLFLKLSNKNYIVLKISNYLKNKYKYKIGDFVNIKYLGIKNEKLSNYK